MNWQDMKRRAKICESLDQHIQIKTTIYGEEFVFFAYRDKDTCWQTALVRPFSDQQIRWVSYRKGSISLPVCFLLQRRRLLYSRLSEGNFSLEFHW